MMPPYHSASTLPTVGVYLGSRTSTLSRWLADPFVTTISLAPSGLGAGFVITHSPPSPRTPALGLYSTVPRGAPSTTVRTRCVNGRLSFGFRTPPSGGASSPTLNRVMSSGQPELFPGILATLTTGSRQSVLNELRFFTLPVIRAA